MLKHIKELFKSSNSNNDCQTVSWHTDQNARPTKLSKKEQLNDQKMNAFLAPLSQVPHYPVSGSGSPVKKTALKDLDAIKHTNITRSTSSDKYFRFIAIDIETTGLDSRSDIIEVSAVKWVGGEPVEVFSTLCKTDKPIPPDATVVNHITADMLVDAPYFYNILPDLQSFIADFPLVGHNIDFDLKFLRKYGLDVTSEKRLFFDTIDLARKCIKDDDIANYKLETLCDYFHIKCSAFHRSLCDAYATSLIFTRLISRIVG